MRTISKNIKGITVEINGETGPLDKALQGVNKTSRDLQSELRNVERLLKLDPKNTVLLEQKQKLLAESITNTKDKLVTLKTAEEQAQQKFAEGKISEEQYRKLQQEVIKTEQELKRLEKAAAESNTTLNKIAETSDKIAKGAKNVGNKMKPATVAITGLAVGAVAAFKSVDEGMDIVIKKTGATGESADELEKIYKDLASSVPDSMESVGSAIGEVNTRFEFTGDVLKSASEDFLKFARINDMDVNSSIQLVSRAMGDAGIESSEYNNVLDMLTAAAQKSGIGIDSLAGNLTKYGAPMRALGLDTETSIAMFAGWEKAGVNTELAFGGMKSAIGKWGKEGKDSKEEFEKTLEAIKSAPDIASATSLAIETFGIKAGPDLADAIQGGRFEIGEYVEALQNSGGVVEATYEQISDGTDDAKTAFNAMKVAGGELGETIMTMLAPILQDIAIYAKTLADRFSGLSEGQQKTIVIVLALIAAIAPMAFIIAGIATAVSFLATGLALLSLPIILTIAAIAAIIAIGVLLWKNWDTITVKLKQFGSFISTKFTEIKNSVVNKVTEIKDATLNKINEIKSGVSTRINDLKNDTISKFTSVVTSAKTKFNEVKDAILNPINTAKDKVKEAVDTIKGFFTGMKLNLPKIKVPKFSLKNWSINPLDWIKNMPSIGVNWNAKGALFTKPTIFNTPMGMQGFGEAGPEAALPLTDKVLGAIGESIARLMPQQAADYNGQPIVFQTNLNGRMIAEEIHGDISGFMGGRTNLNYAMKGV